MVLLEWYYCIKQLLSFHFLTTRSKQCSHPTSPPPRKSAKRLCIAVFSAFLLTACIDSGSDSNEENGGGNTSQLKDPSLSFTAKTDTLPIKGTHRFSATSDSSGAMNWTVTHPDDTATDYATINTSGMLTAYKAGQVKVTVTVAADNTYRRASLSHTLTITQQGNQNTGKVDADGDGLIEIHDLTMLHNMRYNLAGTSYKDAADAVGITLGCPGGSCTGYELVSDLDFDKDGDGTTWSGDSTNGYTLDSGDSQAPYFDHRQWRLGADRGPTPFTATFEGNGL